MKSLLGNTTIVIYSQIFPILGDYSVLEARFYFERHFGYFLMNFYVPCTLIVLLCWVAFWTNREATGDRMGMGKSPKGKRSWSFSGITSVLTMVLIANDSKKDAPKVIEEKNPL